MNIDKILNDFKELLPSTCEMDDLRWRPDETMMQTRIYKVGAKKYDQPPFYEVLPLPESAKKRLKQYLDKNNLEYEFSTDSEYFDIGRVTFPTLRIWEEEPFDFDMDEDLSGNSWTKFYQDELQRTYHTYKDPEGNELGGYYFVDNDGDGYYTTYLKNSKRSKQFSNSKDAIRWVETNCNKNIVEESKKKKKNVAGFFSTLYPGDPKKNIEAFNNSTQNNVPFSEISEGLDSKQAAIDLIKKGLEHHSFLGRKIEQLEQALASKLSIEIEKERKADPLSTYKSAKEKVEAEYKNLIDETNNKITTYQDEYDSTARKLFDLMMDANRNFGITQKDLSEKLIKNLQESFKYEDWVYLSDIIEGMNGNVSDAQLDNDLRLFKRIAQKLHVRNMDDVVVMVTDDEYNPQYYITEVGQKIGPVYKNNDAVNEYEIDQIHLVAENHPTGNVYLYFTTENDARSWCKYVDKSNGMEESLNEVVGKGWNRERLIAAISSFGEKQSRYHFDRYSDQTLFRLLNRLNDEKEREEAIRDAYSSGEKKEQKRDPDYDIPDDERDQYGENMTIKQKLNMLDEAALDSGRYLDIRNMYEAMSDNMSAEDREELRKVVNATNDPEIVAAYLAGKYKKTDENLQETLRESATSKLRDAVIEYLEFLDAMETPFPEGKFLADSWADWVDGLTMGIDPEIESAEVLMQFFRSLYSTDKKLIAKGADDYETDQEVELYETMRKYYKEALEEAGYPLEEDWEEEWPDEEGAPYTVYHNGAYYYGEEDGWNGVDHQTYSSAISEFKGLQGAGFDKEDLYLKDNKYGVTFDGTDWY